MKKSFPFLVMVTLLAAACGGFGPPPECAEGLGGTADEALFAQHFTSMELVNTDTGQPGADSDNGAAFAAGDTLVIHVTSLDAVSLRACVQFMTQRQISFDQTVSLEAGPDEIVLGTFEQGIYVVRVILDGVLVKNFPFNIQ